MNEKDSLEQFISLNKEKFDHLHAPVEIEKNLFPQETRVHSLWKIVAVAASALLLISVGYILGSKSSTRNLAGWDQYEETEKYYNARINQKMEQIKTLGVHDEVMADIRILDDVYLEMRNQIMEDPDADPKILLRTMVKHHQQKLEVMEEIVNRVDKYKSNENVDHEM